MKHLHFIIIVVILLLGCTSRSDKSIVIPTNPINQVNDTPSEKYAVVSDFLDTKIKDHSKKIMIHSQKINTDMTLRILRLNEIYALDSIDRTKNYEDKTFYKEANWEIARKKYSKNTISEIENATYIGSECFWVSENFINKNIIIEEVEFGTKAYEIKYFYRTPYYNFFNFSNPIYYQNKEYLIFYCSYGSVFPPEYYNSAIIIYTKKNGKWVQTHEGAPASFS
jgi:hypothetical protein